MLIKDIRIIVQVDGFSTQGVDVGLYFIPLRVDLEISIITLTSVLLVQFS